MSQPFVAINLVTLGLAKGGFVDWFMSALRLRNQLLKFQLIFKAVFLTYYIYITAYSMQFINICQYACNTQKYSAVAQDR